MCVKCDSVWVCDCVWVVIVCLSLRLSIPVTHCDTSSDLVHRVCYNDSNFQCQSKDNPNPVRIDARNEVYLGQFRTICKHSVFND